MRLKILKSFPLVFVVCCAKVQARSSCTVSSGCAGPDPASNDSDANNLHEGAGTGEATRHEQYEFTRSQYYQKIRANESSFTPHERSGTFSPTCTPAYLRAGLLGPGGAFYQAADGQYYFEPGQCRLRRLSGANARQCLAGRQIAFLGDSVTRYQYMSLADFLSQMRYQARYGEAPGSPSMSMSWEWGDWTDYYKGSSEKLAQAVSAEALEACQCSRSDVPNTFIQQHQAGRIKEDREFILAPKRPSDGPGQAQQAAAMRVSYQQIYDLPTFHQAGLHGLMQALRHRSITVGAPDAIVMNQGLWAFGAGDLDHTSDPFRRAALQSIIETGGLLAAQLNNTELLWKTTTVTADVEEQLYEMVDSGSTRAAAESKAWTLYDVRSITAAAAHQGLDFMTDNLHFIPLMYEQFNDLLLNMLCQPDNTWYQAPQWN